MRAFKRVQDRHFFTLYKRKADWTLLHGGPRWLAPSAATIVRAWKNNGRSQSTWVRRQYRTGEGVWKLKLLLIGPCAPGYFGQIWKRRALAWWQSIWVGAFSVTEETWNLCCDLWFIQVWHMWQTRCHEENRNTAWARGRHHASHRLPETFCIFMSWWSRRFWFFTGSGLPAPGHHFLTSHASSWVSFLFVFVLGGRAGMQWLFSMFNCSSHSHWREEEDWVQYFMAQYMYDKVLIERDRAKYNVSNLLTATWHCGETKMTHPGHLASQQTAEMLHRKVKRDVLRGNKPKKTHMEVVTAFADACQLWCSPLVDASTDRPLTLSAPSNCLALCFPPTPDAWMLQDSSRCMRQHGLTNPVKV